MNGQVYLCFDGSGLWKIGIASDPNKRLKQMKTGNSTIRMPLKVQVDYPAAVELELHTKFFDKRIAGEWFDLEPEDLFYIYNRLLGSGNRHPLSDFVTIHRMISKEKNASDHGWLKELDRRFREIEENE
jgi:hypothetical protein